jgi:hypothetical protein
VIMSSICVVTRIVRLRAKSLHLANLMVSSYCAETKMARKSIHLLLGTLCHRRNFLETLRLVLVERLELYRRFQYFPRSRKTANITWQSYTLDKRTTRGFSGFPPKDGT